MIQQSYDSILTKITDSTGMSKEDVETKVTAKLTELQDLVSKEGAAQIIANELSVKLFNPQESKEMKINEIMPGLNSLTVAGKITAINEIRTYNSKGRSGRVASFMMGDETSTIRVTVWDEKLIDELPQLKEGMIVKVHNAYSKLNNNFKELHLGNRSQIQQNPKDVVIGEVSKPKVERKKISEIKDNETAEIFGTIVQIFEPKYYQACPFCNKKVLLQEDVFRCEQHGTVSPKQIPIVNFFLDDSTGNMRAVCFRDQANKLLGEDFESFETVRNNTLGKQVIVRGRVNTNEMFNRQELVVFAIEEPNPESLVEEMEVKVKE